MIDLQSCGTLNSSISSAVAAAQRHHPRVLVVEDNLDGARALGKILEIIACSVKLASNAEEAIHLAESEPFDLVVSDIGLPGIDGFALMAELRDRFALPGIALTGLSGSEESRLCQDSGFVEHLTKPVEIPRLEEAIRRVLGPVKFPLADTSPLS